MIPSIWGDWAYLIGALAGRKILGKSVGGWVDELGPRATKMPVGNHSVVIKSSLEN